MEKKLLIVLSLIWVMGFVTDNIYP